MNQRSEQRLFTAPVNPEFIEAWKTYTKVYKKQIAAIDFYDLTGIRAPSSDGKPSSQPDWEYADEDAKDQVAAIEGVFEFALQQVTSNIDDFEDDFQDDIEDGTLVWNRLKNEIGVDLRGIFRRRKLVPFVLIPRHVSQHHGDAEKLSLLTHLQEAQSAFIFGVHLSALALMRSILETTLKSHYGAKGGDLKERIDNCEGLPDRCSKLVLHEIRMRANDVLHMEKDNKRLPGDLERKLLTWLDVLRRLIEGAPSSASDSRRV